MGSIDCPLNDVILNINYDEDKRLILICNTKDTYLIKYFNYIILYYNTSIYINIFKIFKNAVLYIFCIIYFFIRMFDALSGKKMTPYANAVLADSK